ncbi:MAG: hypothetical protein NTW86_33050, partial [Candidatus Sumerlaeota bacterium]|nr:hypothetical protein [Candidatus Sumerlaeota bacterium]
VTTDTLLTLWETFAVYWFVRGWLAPENAAGRAWRIGMWAGFGLAFLTKGPPGLLPLAAIVAFAAVKDGWAGVLRLFSLLSLFTFVATGLGWYLAVIAAYPELFGYFTHTAIVTEMLTGHWGRNAGFLKLFAVYLPPLALGALPWLVLALLSARSWVRAARALPKGRAALRAAPHTFFLLFWVAIPLAAFCAAQSRLPLYVLPLFVPLSLLLAKSLAGWFTLNGWTRAWVAAWIAVLIGGRWVASVYPTDRDSRALARILAERAPAPPKEFVFVDVQPWYGLSLYFDAEVENASVRVEGDLRDEMAEGESALLFAVAPAKAARFERKMAEIGPPMQALGEMWGMRLYWLPRARQTAPSS